MNKPVLPITPQGISSQGNQGLDTAALETRQGKLENLVYVVVVVLLVGFVAAFITVFLFGLEYIHE